MAFHNKVGNWGEQVAAEYLIGKGYIVRDRNWRLGKLEIDIVAEKDGVLVVVEVKTRSTNFADPILAITRRKRMNLVNAGVAYLRCTGINLGLRFDYILLEGNEMHYELENLEDAIDTPTKFYR